MATKNYNAKETLLEVGGVPIDSGFGPDEFCSIEFNEKSFEKEVGSDGEVTLTRLNDDTAMAKITLGQAGAGNAILSGLYNLSKNGTKTAGTVTFSMTDLINGESTISTEAVIEGPPSPGYGKKAGTREWSLLLLDSEYIHLALG